MFDFIDRNRYVFIICGLVGVLFGMWITNYLWGWNKQYEFNYDRIDFEKMFHTTIDVVDGDTIRVFGKPARIVGIDTPEIWSAKCNTERREGYAASSKLLALIRSGPVRLKWEKGSDKYGRLLVRIYVNGRDISETAVEKGWARKYDEKSRRKGWC